MEKKDYILERGLKENAKMVTYESMKELTDIMEKKICKIFSQDFYGTGFFCNIKDGWDSIKILMTNNHVLSEEDILPNKKINLSFKNDEKKLEMLIDKERKTYTDSSYDVTIIEIKKSDGINIDSFFEIEDKIFLNDVDEVFRNNAIYLLHYSQGGRMNFSNGIISNIKEDNYTIEHNCDSKKGSSGGPLINSVNLKIIGIHRGGNIDNENYNVGTLLKEPISLFIEKMKFKEDNINKKDLIFNDNANQKYNSYKKNKKIKKDNKNMETFMEKKILLNSLEEKLKQKQLLLKISGGITNNPELGKEVTDLLIKNLKVGLSILKVDN